MSQGPELKLDGAALAALDEAVGADGTALVIDLILGSVPRLREQMRAAAFADNLQGVERAAHQLKSECAHVGATVLSTCLQDLESRAAAHRLEWPPAEVARVFPIIDRFLELLRGVRDARTSAVQP